MAFEKKGVYHKELVEFGKVQLKILGAAFKSKYPDNYGKEQYTVKFSYDGVEHYYNGKRELAETLGSYTGQTVDVTAEKDGFKVEGGASKPQGAVTRGELPDPKAALHAATIVGNECLIGKKIAFAKAKELHDAIKEKYGIEFPLEQLTADANSIFIHMGQRGGYGSGGVIAGLSQ